MIRHRVRLALIVLLAGLSIGETLACLILIPTVDLWPVRMVAREISPWFVIVNLLGVALAVRRRVAAAIFVVGLAVTGWPLVQIGRIRGGITDEWRQQRFEGSPDVVGPMAALIGSIRGVRVPAIEPALVSPTIALYRSPAYPPSQRLPVIIDIHGGSWQSGDVRDDDVFARRMASKGFAVFAVDYRKAPRFTHPAQRDDVEQAIVWVHAHAAQLDADPNRIALVGRSAGGHLAMLAAYHGSAVPIRAVVNFYGPTDLAAIYAQPPSPDPINVRSKAEAFLGGTPAAVPNAYRDASPTTWVRGGLPPTLHIQGGADHIVEARFTREIDARLRAAGSRSLLLEIPWADHAFDVVYFGVGNQVAESVLDAFLAQTLRP